jgi:Cdc6-like AAA superfamily ATPase
VIKIESVGISEELAKDLKKKFKEKNPNSEIRDLTNVMKAVIREYIASNDADNKLRKLMECAMVKIKDDDDELSEADKELLAYFYQEDAEQVKRKDVFTEEFVPDRLVHREDKPKELMGYMKRSYDVIMTGIPATGKTALVKKDFRILKHDKKLLCIYVNCRNRTPIQVLSYIYREMGKILKWKGQSFDTFMELIHKRVEEIGVEKVYICFDEIDSLKGELDLYPFADSSKYNMILVANTINWYENSIDERVESRLNPIDMEMKAYNRDEIKDILLERVKLGVNNEEFFSNLELDYVVDVCSEKKYDSLRMAIKLLSRVIDKKIEWGRPVRLDEVKMLFADEREFNIMRKFDGLDEKGKFIVDIIKHFQDELKNNPQHAYKRATQKRIKSYWNSNYKPPLHEIKEIKTLQTHLKRLVKYGYIKQESIKTGQQGRPEVYYELNI